MYRKSLLLVSIDFTIEATCRKIWNLPKGLPKAACLYAPQDELCLNLLTIWEGYCSSPTTNSWTQILNDNGALGATARASLFQATTKFKQWPLNLAFHTHREGRPLCPSIIAHNIATLIAADLRTLGVTEIGQVIKYRPH